MAVQEQGHHCRGKQKIAQSIGAIRQENLANVTLAHSKEIGYTAAQCFFRSLFYGDTYAEKRCS